MTYQFSADVVHPVASAPIEGGVIVTDGTGKILDLLDHRHRDKSGVQKHKGWLVPGMINTHCHLELSHMRGRVDTGTGLIPFITSVVTKRNMAQRIIQTAIKRADLEMYKAGIVAVGDISNQVDTFVTKAKSKISYYTFVELFDFLQEQNAESTHTGALAVHAAAPHTAGHARSMVPHAPYSVSKSLFAKINTTNPKHGITVSIHNQETPDEEALFLNKTGGFPAFYGAFGISLEQWQPTGQSAIHYALAHMEPKNRTLFVHNTLTTAADIATAHVWSSQVFWATCPNANLYIENRLPNYQAFIDAKARMTIGTDSLTSNWQLSVLEEMKTIQRFQSYVTTEDLLTWATLNGAQALGMDARLGSFVAEKMPGICLLAGLSKSGQLTQKTQIKRLI
jgi:aminodeoxyfutalosine deaminase